MMADGADAAASPTSPTPNAAVPEQIGPYRILEPLGQGGMATVYLAEQHEPVFRRVALKLIHLGMDTEQVLARFGAEHQALAMMNHDNIARVHDAGSTERGQPYFVMELVKGLPIHEHCDRHKLTTRERLELFVSVCAGIQHAHTKAIIHRDLKPSNILVAEQGDRLVPKIIDFGLARAVDHRLTERTLYTEHGKIVGTPEYMSPEQAEMSSEDIDTRTDVYSLGVILYELLVGALPFKGLRDAGYLEMQRRIREEDPQRPSTRLTSTRDLSAQVAELRRTDFGGLLRELRGDLDWITMKALEKERTRRYQTASELAADIERHLRDEPVAAGPPGTLYRARKFVRRHRAGVLSATLVSIALIAGLVATTLALRTARAEAARADQQATKATRAAAAADAARVREEEARLRAERNERQAQADAARAQTMTDFLVDVFASADPAIVRRPDISARELLDEASARIGPAFAEHPDDEATIRTTIGKAYVSLGERELAEAHLRRALALLRASSGADGEKLLDVYEALYPIVDPMGPEGIAFPWINLCFRMLSDDARLTALMQDFAAAYWVQKTERLVEIGEEVKREARFSLTQGHRLWRPYAEVFQLAGTYALRRFENPQLAEFMLEESLSVLRDQLDLPPTDPRITWTLRMLVEALLENGKLERADALVQDFESAIQEILPEGHWQLALPTILRGECLAARGKLAEARELLEHAHAAVLASAGPDSYPARRSAVSLMDLCLSSGQFDEAARYWALHPDDQARVQWARAERFFAEPHAELWESMSRLDEALRHGLPDVSARWREVQAQRGMAFGIEDPRALGYGGVVRNWANSAAPLADRQSMWQEVLAIREAQLPTDHDMIAAAHGHLATVHEAAGQFEAGEQHARAALVIWERRDRRTFGWAVAKDALGGCLLGQGRYPAAESELEAAYGFRLEVKGPKSREAREIACKLLVARVAQDRIDEARRLQRDRGMQFVRWVHVRRLIADRHPDLARALDRLDAVVRSDAVDRDARAEEAWRAVHAARVTAFPLDAPLAIPYGEPLYQWAVTLANGPARDAAHEPMLREVLAIQEIGLPPNDPKTAKTLWWLAIKHERRGAWEDGERFARRGLAIRREFDDERESQDTAYLRSVLGNCLFRQGHVAEAESHLVRGHGRLLALRSATAVETNNATFRLADFYHECGHAAKAATLWQESLDAELANPSSPAWLSVKCAWVATWPGLDRELYELGLEAAERALHYEPDEATHHLFVGAARLRLGDADLALAAVECAIERRRAPVPIDFAVLALVQHRRGAAAEAIAALTWMRELLPTHPPRTATTRRILREAEATVGGS